MSFRQYSAIASPILAELYRQAAESRERTIGEVEKLTAECNAKATELTRRFQVACKTGDEL